MRVESCGFHANAERLKRARNNHVEKYLFWSFRSGDGRRGTESQKGAWTSWRTTSKALAALTRTIDELFGIQLMGSPASPGNDRAHLATTKMVNNAQNKQVDDNLNKITLIS